MFPLNQSEPKTAAYIVFAAKTIRRHQRIPALKYCREGRGLTFKSMSKSAKVYHNYTIHTVHANHSWWAVTHILIIMTQICVIGFRAGIFGNLSFFVKEQSLNICLPIYLLLISDGFFVDSLCVALAACEWHIERSPTSHLICSFIIWNTSLNVVIAVFCFCSGGAWLWWNRTCWSHATRAPSYQSASPGTSRVI